MTHIAGTVVAQIIGELVRRSGDVLITTTRSDLLFFPTMPLRTLHSPMKCLVALKPFCVRCVWLGALC
jgi:hypothetical protein